MPSLAGEKDQALCKGYPQHVKNAFNTLMDESEQRRAEASIIILKYVDSSLQDEHENQLTENVKSIIRRLVGGLITKRPYAREGFYTTLQAVMQLHPSTVSVTYEVADTKLAPNPSLEKEDQTAQLVGEVLYYGALIRSGHASSDPSRIEYIILRLLEIRQMEDYLDIMASQFLVNLMEERKDIMSSLETVWMKVKPLLDPEVRELSPCLLWLRLVMLRTSTASTLPKEWTSSSRIPKFLARAIMGTVNSLPNVHPLVGEVVTSLAPKSQEGRNYLISLWIRLKGHLSMCTVKELQLIFNVLQLVVPRLRTAQEVPMVLSGNLIPLLMTSVSRHDQELSTAARGMASALLHLVSSHQHENSEIQLAVLRALVLPPGSIRFDQLTGTKLLSQMMSHLSLSSLKGFAEILQESIENAAYKDVSGNEQYVVNTLKQLILHPKLSTEEHDEWRRQKLMAIMKLALFCSKSNKNKMELRSAFNKTLVTYSGGNFKDYWTSLEQVVCEANKELQSQEEQGKSPLGVGGAARWVQVQEKLAMLKSDNMKDTIPSKVFQLIYTQMALYLFLDHKVAKDIIEELNACCKMMMMSENPKSQSKETEGQPHWVEVVTELLLSLMTQEEHYIRFMAQNAFRLMCPLATPHTSTIILDILDLEKAKTLVSKRLDEEEEAEEEKEAEEEAEEEEEKEEESCDDDSDFEEEHAELDDEEGMEEVDDNLKNSLMAAMGDFEDDIDMDSVPIEELNKLDEKVEAIFSQFSKKQAEKKKRQKLAEQETSLMHFQNRACDLLMVFIKEVPKLSLILDIISPLFDAFIMAGKNKLMRSLQGRLRSLIQDLVIKLRKFPNEKDVTVSVVVDSWNEFFTASLDMPDNLTKEITGCYGALVHLCVEIQDSKCGLDNPVITSYLQHLDKLLSTQMTSVKVVAYLVPCTIECSGLRKVAEEMAQAAFNSALKPYKRSLALEGLQKLYENKAFLEERTRELDETIAPALLKMLSEFCTSGAALKKLKTNLLNLIFVLHKNDELKDGQSIFNWQLVGDGVVKMRQSVTRKEFAKCIHVYHKLQHSLNLPRDISFAQKPVVVQKNDKAQLKMKKQPQVNGNSVNHGKSTPVKNMKQQKAEKRKNKKMMMDKKRKRVTFADSENGEDDYKSLDMTVSKKNKKRKRQASHKEEDTLSSHGWKLLPSKQKT
ncbi:hypothetical protein Pcinc_027399 [Petrolisthes cinctipes]|uniref:Myb-binding protein 1A-like protein n=1 Tax=Petrolisthes cinctipes TaxID=88211 RepID=A0AAE1KAW0_PETCI|nr:hypothetical protein Pcinc_027399 [Petrolisthes cinctipes]